MTFNGLPIDVREKVKDITINQIGIQLACATLPWSKTLIHVIQELGGNPISTVAYYGLKTSLSTRLSVTAPLATVLRLTISICRPQPSWCMGIPLRWPWGMGSRRWQGVYHGGSPDNELMLRLTQIAGFHCCGRVRTHISDGALWLGGWSCQASGTGPTGYSECFCHSW